MVVKTVSAFPLVVLGLVLGPCCGFVHNDRRLATWNHPAHNNVCLDPLRGELMSPLLGVNGKKRLKVTLYNNRFDNEYDDVTNRRAAQKAAGKGGGEAAAGAILGAMLGGPFGALFGAQIGASVGSNRAFDKAKEGEMKQMGITKEMLEMAEDSGLALESAMEGLKATRDSYETQQAFARRLDSDSNRLYEQAKAAMATGEEDKARDLLLGRQGMQEKLKKALINCADARKRLEQQENNVAALEGRAMEVEALLRRGVGAKVMQGSSDQTSLSLSNEDPLLKKFRDLGMD